jgi:hypothetical protein
MSVLDMTCGSLPPTATYQRRDYVWLPADPGDYDDGRLGTLTIVLQHSRRAGAKQTSDTYAVERESEPTPGVVGRSFLLCNLTDPDQEDVYRTVVAPHRSGDSCTCDAGRVDTGRKRKAAGELPCKHRDTLRALIEEGAVGLT